MPEQRQYVQHEALYAYHPREDIQHAGAEHRQYFLANGHHNCLMPSKQTSSTSRTVGQNPAIHGLLWFVGIFAASYFVIERPLRSSVVIAGGSATFYAAVVYFWEPY